jgi:hypothetical protein
LDIPLLWGSATISGFATTTGSQQRSEHFWRFSKCHTH